jgi:glycerophosphoryl diester phosphodiesterase
LESRTLITAHSGCLDSGPNTVESVRLGLVRGGDFSEVDVRLTSDGEVILWHDKEIGTKNHGTFRINGISYKKLKELESEDELILKHEKAEITLLSEALDSLKNVEGKLNLDIKDDFSIPVLTEIVRSKNFTHRVVVSGCKKISAAYFKTSYPDFQVLLNADTRGLEQKGRENPEEIQAICDEAALSSCCGINIEYKYCTPLLVDMAKKSFLPVSVWTINDSEDMKKFIHMGVNNITTIYPDILKSIIEKEGLK